MKQSRPTPTRTAGTGATLSATDLRALTSRLRRAEGQVRAVARLIEAGEPCDVVAQQLTAARRALDKTFFEMIGCALQHRQIATEDVSVMLRKYA